MMISFFIIILKQFFAGNVPAFFYNAGKLFTF